MIGQQHILYICAFEYKLSDMMEWLQHKRLGNENPQHYSSTTDSKLYKKN